MSELSPQARAFLEEHRHDGQPTAADAERVLSALETHLKAAPLVASGSRFWLVKAGSIATLIGIAVMIALASRPAHPPSPSPPPVREVPVAEVPRSVAPQIDPVEAPLPAKRPLRRPSPPPAPPVSPVADLEPAPSPPATPEPLEERAAPSLPPPVVEPTLEDEMRLVTRAQQHLRQREPLQALEVVAQWDTLFGQSGQLTQEALATRIIALCEAGQVERGHLEAEQYLASFPNSPHRDHIRRRCPANEAPSTDK